MPNKNQRLDWRTASSSLRMILNHPEATGQSLDRFRVYEMRGTDYIYNMIAGNIIATRRRIDSERTLLRYRPASHYANILREYGERKGFIVIASTNVGRWQRRVNRGVREMSPYPRTYALEQLHRGLGLGKDVYMREIKGLEPLNRPRVPEQADQSSTASEQMRVMREMQNAMLQRTWTIAPGQTATYTTGSLTRAAMEAAQYVYAFDEAIDSEEIL